MTKKMQQALAVLRMYINDMGREFTDTYSSVCWQFKLTDKEAERLKREYDGNVVGVVMPVRR